MNTYIIAIIAYVLGVLTPLVVFVAIELYVDWASGQWRSIADAKREAKMHAEEAAGLAADIRDLHRKNPASVYRPQPGERMDGVNTDPICTECGENYPCPTVRLTEGL